MAANIWQRFPRSVDMKRYEYTIRYMVDSLSHEDRIKALNRMGKDGWELCACYRQTFKFKRELRDS